MVDTKIKDLAEKATGAATDEFVINDVAGGDADKKMGMDGLRLAATQIGDGTVSNTEFQRINSVTSNVQTQFDALADIPAFSGNGLKVLRLNTGETALEYGPVTTNIPLLNASQTFTGLETIFKSSSVNSVLTSEVTTTGLGSVALPSLDLLRSSVSDDMTDGFGSGISFSVKDDTSAIISLGNMLVVRDGTDDTGKFRFNLNNGGSGVTVQTITSLGAVDWPETGPHTNILIDADGTGNVLTNIGSSEIKAEIVTGLSEEATPAAGDFLLGVETGGALRKFDVDNLPAAGGNVTTKICATDLDKTTDTTLEDIPDLTIALAANTKYFVRFVLKAFTHTDPEHKILFVNTGGGTWDFSWSDPGGLQVNDHDMNTTVSFTGGPSSATNRIYYFFGTLATDGTAGNFKVQFAQDISDAQTVSALEGSILQVTIAN